MDPPQRLRERNSLISFKDIDLNNGSSRSQNLALTVLCVSISLEDPLSLPPILPHFPVDPAQCMRAGYEAQKGKWLKPKLTSGLDCLICSIFAYLIRFRLKVARPNSPRTVLTILHIPVDLPQRLRAGYKAQKQAFLSL